MGPGSLSRSTRCACTRRIIPIRCAVESGRNVPCFSPLEGWRLAGGGFTATRSKSATGAPMTIPCGRCMGCRLQRSQHWATRIALEASMHDENAFLTLTYSDDRLPADGGLQIRDLQLFMKRLRKVIAPVKVRYYACGEYGETTWRPHYHIVLFGYQFPDLVPIGNSPKGSKLFQSALLDRIWGRGLCSVGSVTKQSGGYVARYVLKKVTGEPASDWYLREHPVTRDLFQVCPEFALMSSRPGIAGDWFDKFASDCFPSDFLVLNGSKVPVPPFFANKLKGRNESGDLVVRDDFTEVRNKRKAHQMQPKVKWNNSPERLAVRAELTAHRIERLKRDMEG